MEFTRQFDGVVTVAHYRHEHKIILRVSVLNWGDSSIALAYSPRDSKRYVAVVPINSTGLEILAELAPLAGESMLPSSFAASVAVQGCCNTLSSDFVDNSGKDT